MQWLAALCVRRPVFATVLILSLTVIGAFSFMRLGVDQFPKVDFPTVVITTFQPGAAPEQIETEVTDKIEEAVNTISGIDELRSTSSEGVSVVFVSFLLDKSTDVAAQEVRDKINSVLPQLPRTIEQPRIEKMDPDAAPVLSLSVASKRPVREVTEFADKVLRRQLESVSGVGQVLVLGGRERQVNIWLDADRLRQYNLTVTDVSHALQAQNLEVPGGRVDQGSQSMTLRTRGRVQSVAEFGDVILRERSGHPIRVADVAQVEDGEADADTIASLDGTPTVLLQVRRQSGTNTVEVVDAVLDRIAEIKTTLPSGYDVRVVQDRSDFIRASIHRVEEHLVVGSILAALVVLLFLVNLRSTVIAAIAIPTSIVASFGLVWYMGFTLNMMTMLALTLAVGIVIDDAIVVLENIYRFIEEKGEDQQRAAIDATEEIGLAVLATTLSLVAIFVPVGFMGGIVGRFMQSFGLTMAFAILVSLLVSFTLTPMLGARWLKVRRHGADRHSSKDARVFHAVDVAYTRMLTWAMSHRAFVAGVAVVVLLSSVPLFIVAPKNFMPQEDQGEFEINLRAPEGTSLEATELIVNRIASAVRAQVPEVEFTLATIGGDQSKTRNLASVYVRLRPLERRTRDQIAVMGTVRSEILPPLAAGLRTSVQPVAMVGGGGSQNADVQFLVNGPDLHALESIGRQLIEKAKSFPGVVDVDSSLHVGKPELGVHLDRPKAADLGVQVADAAEALRLLVGGDQVTTYNEGSEQYEVHLRATAPNRSTEQAIGALAVPSARLGSVSLDNVATFSSDTAPSDINRLGRQRQVTIMANLLPSASQSTVQNAIADEFARLRPGSEYRGAYTGRSRELGRAAQNFVMAFLLSLVFMYLILAAQFESWLHPITILLSLPLTLPFALLSIIIFRQSLNIFSALGLLVLFGVVKKNSILQIDHANQLREKGLDAHDASIQASRDRLRPILMTTFAFVAGMLPLIISSGSGAGTNRAIGFVIFGGQSMALVLTLIVTPVAYTLFADAQEWLARRRAVRTDTRTMAHRAGHVALPLLLAALALPSFVAKASAQETSVPFRAAVANAGHPSQAAGSSQTTGAPMAATLELTVDEAVRLALENNLDLAVDRLDPQVADTQMAGAAGAFRPTLISALQNNNQLQPPSSFLIPTATRTAAVNSTLGMAQRLPWLGTSYSLSWDSSRTNSNSFLTSYDPLVRSGLGLNVSQPLLRDRTVDAPRLQQTTTRLNRDAVGTRLKESEVRTVAAVKSAYWSLIAARANVEARQTALELAEELARVNRAKVDVGQSPPLDLVSAQAEVVSNQERAIVADMAVRQLEDRLRLLIFDATRPDAWTVSIRPIDAPPTGMMAVDSDAAIANALASRVDLARARIAVSAASAVEHFNDNQRLPDVRLNASYQANGLGGTEVLRTGGFPGVIVGPGRATPFGNILDQLARADYPTWAAGVSISYPIGQSTQDAALARSRVEHAQAEARLKSAQAHAIQQVREAAWKVEMNAKRVDTTRAVATLAEQRLDAERKRFDVGMSTSFLVIQAQRDFVDARTDALAAILAYDLALVDLEAVQQAGPAGAAQAGNSAASPASSLEVPVPVPSIRPAAALSALGVPGL
jgi:hydrophobic/amphiphilic exporter-1 (mainly G- bacteria), HAE1 family